MIRVEDERNLIHVVVKSQFESIKTLVGKFVVILIWILVSNIQ